jgi:4-methoxybenzoate monooxygenase (O-demethylating)
MSQDAEGSALVTGASSGRGPFATAPVSDVDPFSIEFFEDPFPVHESLREAGPVV